ncbi:glycosyltransferase family 2 protein [Magnetospirillum moscoviense]|uniref:Glycosyltransferase 2-like domain-containing protein n=1 Tax=Magnetospirillum moscoviense TaxID=1437059 RepID=A0A178M8Q2_9PROT|nr:glycosyltransferase family A protein [Magnetospirillum moscoviense]OAN44906.1 hypothetical protein A6A05_17310 [Magnetospirillum moscoviense]
MGNPGNSSRDKLISIILPTIRPDLAGAALQSIVACSDDVRYEIVVVSPFPVQGKNIVHVKEEVPKGNCAAHAMGYQASSGDIIVAMSDDHIALDGWLTPVQSFIEQRETQYFPFCAGINRPQSPWFGAVYGLYYPYFPVLSRQSAEAIGGFFSPDFTAHFGDPDLAMRVWKAGGGGRCELLYEANLAPNKLVPTSKESAHKHTSLEKDLATFTALYHQDFGRGFSRDLKDINSNYAIHHLRDRTFMARVPQRHYMAELEQRHRKALGM